MQTIFVIMQEIKSSVLIVCNRVPFPLKDGGALAMYAQIKGWHDLGKAVHVVCMNTSRHRVVEASLPALFQQISSFKMLDIDTDIKVINVLRNLLFSRKPEHAERFYNLRFEQVLIEQVQSVQPDIIQLESIYLDSYIPALRQHSKAKLIQRLHNIESEVWYRLAKETKYLLKRWYLFNLAKRIAQFEQDAWQHCDALLPISEADTHKIMTSGIQKALCTIPYGIELKEQANTTWPAMTKAYHIGAMDWQPNIDAMEWMCTEIITEVCKVIPDFCFYFAGRNMPQQFFSQQSKHIVCAGEVPNAAAFIADKAILVVPLRSGSGIRVKTLEAMAAQKLVISTQIGMQGIAAQNGIHFIQADSSQAFVAAILWAQQNPEVAYQIACNGASLVRSQYQQKILMEKEQHFIENLS
jgi:glycosyltransferase involved in cell wall biosynthesis